MGRLRVAALLLPAIVLLPEVRGLCSEPPVPPGGSAQDTAVVPVDPDDPRLVQATQQARRTLKTFLTHLASPAPDMSGFAVKGAFLEGSTVEAIWVSDVSYANGVFTGRLSNDPQELRRLHYGDRVQIKEREILDWMIVKGHKLLGGFTIRAMRDLLDAKGRAAFDESLGLEF